MPSPRVVPTQRPYWLVLSLALLLGLSWAVGVLLGGADRFAPHWFYVAILMAASKLGLRGAAIAAVAGGILAGPLLPADVAAGRSQLVTDWMSRMAWFVAVGQAMALILARRARAERALQHSRLTITALTERLWEQHAEDGLRARLEARIRRALKGDRLRIVFQPIVDLRDGRVRGVEALSRFDLEPRRDPQLWFEEATRLGLGVELEMLAMRAALDKADLGPELFLSVNLSPASMCDPAFAELLQDLGSRQIIVEATEHHPVDDYAVLHQPLAALRGAGGKLAVDDAGAGFASLRHILELGPELIKLDRELVRHVDDDPARRALATGLIAFAEAAGASIVAEGIQTEAELETLRSLGVHLGQGFLLCRPVPLSELALDGGGRVLDLHAVG